MLILFIDGGKREMARERLFADSALMVTIHWPEHHYHVD